MSGPEIPFTKQMRIATTEIHNVSDALVNAKLGLAMSEDRVWAEGLLVFYEIFKYLEGAMDRLQHTLIGDLDIPGMRRTDAFEKDLVYYLGENWKEDYIPRKSVCEYVEHLEYLEKENPNLLMAYIYHLYMGLFSGGQILRRKRVLVQKLSFSRKATYEGLAVTDVKDGSVHKMKKQISEAMNEIAEKLGDDCRNLLIEESKKVFILNNKIVHTIQGAGAVVLMRLLKYTVYGIVVVATAVLIKRSIVG